MFLHTTFDEFQKKKTTQANNIYKCHAHIKCFTSLSSRLMVKAIDKNISENVNE